ncbi:hypothetical protein HPB48_005288 [Haemaphysalis longicornis]|uniref:ABC transporter domain-containing protein n=1 Tax=Haemaphysalis longicornis TaxID=44386 RepID=A0A9J6GSX2_HAELO|nr:hypothetical protein HPB48_005288 [Haemaphysalis longicornis]
MDHFGVRLELPITWTSSCGRPRFGAKGIASSSLRSPDCELPDAKTFQWSHIKQLSHIAVFIIEAIFLYVFATNLHSGDHVATDSDIKRIVDTEPDPDSDVEEEKRHVNGICEKGSLSDHTMVAQNVHKYYDKLHAVRGINIALEPNECFGLLGVNGAGKTTTFEMLSGLVSLSAGEAYADNLKVTKCPRTWKSRVGYCFQEDGLLELLTAYEILYLLGRLRGIADADLEKLVESLIRVTDLKAYADQRCGTYSGGNKRKLSVATAILGMLPLVFLDEPFAGVDVVARHKILKAVNTLKKESKSTIVLSSHK